MNLRTELEFFDAIDFCITAYYDNRQVGDYAIGIDVVDGHRVYEFLRSQQSGIGVPRTLIQRGTAELEVMARRMRRELVHTAHLITERAKAVLPHLYEEYGYCKTGIDQLTRVYSP